MDVAFPGPLIEVAIAPRGTGDHDRLAAALRHRAASDPAFQFAIDGESGQTIILGSDEAHLDAVIAGLRDDHRIALSIGAPQVAYRETLTKRVETSYTHRSEAGGRKRFARLKIVVEPTDPGAGTAFVSAMVEGSFPRDFILAIEKGVESVMRAGVLGGFPLVGVKATLIDAWSHDEGSSPLAFEIASPAAFRDALATCSVLLEPVMDVEITTPEAHVESIVGDVSIRRGDVCSQSAGGAVIVVTARVPLSALFGYADRVRSLSEGRATLTMRFAEYRVVPPRDDDPGIPPAAMALRA